MQRDYSGLGAVFRAVTRSKATEEDLLTLPVPW